VVRHCEQRTVAIALATFNPKPDLLRRQIDSLQDQTVSDWHCVISDDSSNNLDVIQNMVAHDSRFTLLENTRRQGFYKNFEQAITAASHHSGYVALCDQDDVWHPDKLETQLEQLGNAEMATSFVSVVDVNGTLVGPPVRPMQSPFLLDQIVANSIPGMSMLVKRSLLERALPFPNITGRYHDQWLALCALAGDGIVVTRSELSDYVQHGSNVHGATTFPPIEKGELWSKVLRPIRDMSAVRSCPFESHRALDLALAQLAVDRAGRFESSLQTALREWGSTPSRRELARCVASNTKRSLSPAEGFLLGLKLEQERAQRLLAAEHSRTQAGRAMPS
jgi:hypothetical protein